MNKYCRLFISIFVLVLASLACAGRIFTELRVYSAIPASVEQVYDPATDTILSENVWVFRPDGTFDAIVLVDGKRYMLSGTYDGDDAGEEFIIGLDFNGDGQDDDNIYVDVADDGFSFIEWRKDGRVSRYWLVY